MAVIFHVSGPLRDFTAGRARVEIEASPATAGEALAALWALHTGVRDRIVTETGELRPHVNVFVGTENIRWSGGFGTPLPSGAEISIIPAVSGG